MDLLIANEDCLFSLGYVFPRFGYTTHEVMNMAKKGTKRMKKTKSDILPGSKAREKAKDSDVYTGFDNDLAGDNLRNDIPAADL